jgi:oligosaccharide repeat unit polymerase
LVEYIIGPTAALDYVLQHPQDYANLPHHTFRLFLRITSTSGLMSYHPPPALDAFIFVPFGTNVYTVYKFFITDFGVNAAVIILGILGFLHTLLFRKAHSQSVLGVFLFSLTMFPVLMVIFDDQYSQFGLYIEAVVFAVSYFTIKSFPWKVFRSRATNGYGLRQEV